MSNTIGVRLRIPVLNFLLLIVALYAFLFSINLLGHSFKLFGEGFADSLLRTTSHPFLGLFLGIVATSIIQSSSTTTSIIIGLVAAGALTLENAIPMIMGANIGTTVTNILVSFGHATRRAEFRRAFSAAVVHDLFNVFSVMVLFPVELIFHPIERIAILLQRGFAGIGGMELFNPVQTIISPAISLTDYILAGVPFAAVVMVALSIILLFASLGLLVKIIHVLVLGKVEQVIDKFLFGSDFVSLLLGMALTAIIQSSSVTTSLVVPLAGAGILSVRQVFPFTLGANIGTTVTALLAALATGNPVAVTVAFSHLVFNVFGITVFYPLKFIPITLAERLGDFAGKSQSRVYIVIGGFSTIYIIPLIIFIFL